LESISNTNKANLKNAYYRAIKKGLIELNNNNIPRLTSKGEKAAKLYEPAKLKKNSRLLLIFDIPKAQRWKRDRLRTILKDFRFEQIQKSVWECKYDFLEIILAELKSKKLEQYIILYEASPKTLKIS
jgi:CRISPR-associated endonuclease Cas2